MSVFFLASTATTTWPTTPEQLLRYKNRYFTAIMAEVLKACGHNPDLCLTV
ncbi:unnamed protein product, partial [Ectocarpus sp. 8 AP-2014]